MRLIYVCIAVLTLLFMASCDEGVKKISKVDGDQIAFSDADTLFTGDEAPTDSDIPGSIDSTTKDGDNTLKDGEKPDTDTVTGECANGDTRMVACGTDNKGTQQQTCQNGKWVDSSQCIETGVCQEGATRVVENICGINNRGSWEETCLNKVWEKSSSCNDPDECLDGKEQDIACGAGGKGTQHQKCTLGHWVNEGGCVETPACQNGAERVQVDSCGLNGRGDLAQSCVNGAWKDGTCTDPDVCKDADEKTLTDVCGINTRGEQPQKCVTGQWENNGTCVDPDECKDGTPENGEACGLNLRGINTRTCQTGKWGMWICNDPDECKDADTQDKSCSATGGYIEKQTCTEGHWVTTTPCNDPKLWGRFKCVNNVCTAQKGDSNCGNGSCQPSIGESPKTCPMDCKYSTATTGACSNTYDCAFLTWPDKTKLGYWECTGVMNKTCSPKYTNSYCGTTNYDYCYVESSAIESDTSCAKDCNGSVTECDSDRQCIFTDWPK